MSGWRDCLRFFGHSGDPGWGEAKSKKALVTPCLAFVIFIARSSKLGSPSNDKSLLLCRKLFCYVGLAGFEPTTSSTPCWRDTWLRYNPFGGANIDNFFFICN